MPKTFRPDVKPNQFYPVDPDVYKYAQEDITTSGVQRFFLWRVDGEEHDIIEFPYSGYWDHNALEDKHGIQLNNRYPNGLYVLDEVYCPPERINFTKLFKQVLELPPGVVREFAHNRLSKEIAKGDEISEFDMFSMYYKHMKGIDL